jgi:hypothetical protein
MIGMNSVGSDRCTPQGNNSKMSSSGSKREETLPLRHCRFSCGSLQFIRRKFSLFSLTVINNFVNKIKCLYKTVKKINAMLLRSYEKLHITRLHVEKISCYTREV